LPCFQHGNCLKSQKNSLKIYLFPLDSVSNVQQGDYPSAGAEINFIASAQNAAIELIQVCEQLSGPATREREIEALYAGMDELKLAQATIITRDYSETLSAGNKVIRVLPFYAWALADL